VTARSAVSIEYWTGKSWEHVVDFGFSSPLFWAVSVPTTSTSLRRDCAPPIRIVFFLSRKSHYSKSGIKFLAGHVNILTQGVARLCSGCPVFNSWLVRGRRCRRRVVVIRLIRFSRDISRRVIVGPRRNCRSVSVERVQMSPFQFGLCREVFITRREEHARCGFPPLAALRGWVFRNKLYKL